MTLPTLLDIKIFFITNGIDLLWSIFILIGGKLLLSVLSRKLTVIISRNAHAHNRHGREKRVETLARLLVPIGNITVYMVAFIAFLQTFGVDPLPILAGASVFGFALGFGAQTLIKDFISGIYIFVENQYAVGDKVKIGTFEGTVYKIGIRSTIIIDTEGNFVFIPNGTITNVINISLGEHLQKKGRP